jgi:hypothetical protein
MRLLYTKLEKQQSHPLPSIHCSLESRVGHFDLFLSCPAQQNVRPRSPSLCRNPLSPCTHYHPRPEDSTLLVSIYQPFFHLFSVRHAPSPSRGSQSLSQERRLVIRRDQPSPLYTVFSSLGDSSPTSPAEEMKIGSGV